MSTDIATLVTSAVEREQAGDLTGAVAGYREVLVHDPGNGAALFGLGTCFMLLGHFAAARQAYEDALASFPDHPVILTRLAHLYRQLGHLDQAVDGYERAWTIDPSDPTIGVGEAQALCLLGENERALTVLDRQEAVTGGSPSLDAQRVQTLAGMGRLAEAQYLGDELQTATTDESVVRALLLSDIAGAQWDLVRSERLLADAVNEHPGHQVLHLRHAARLLSQLRPVDAMQVLVLRAELVPLGTMADVRPRATQGLLADIANEFLLDPRTLGAAREALAADDALAAAGLVRAEPGSLAAASALLVTLRRSGLLRIGPPSADAAIPHLVMQAWLGSTPPREVRETTATWRRQPGWRYAGLDDASATEFLRRRVGPDAVLAYQRARHPAARADLVRLAWLAEEGGVWADVDDARRGSLEPLITGRSLVVWQEDRGNLANDFLACSPGHPAIIAARDEAIRNLLDTYTESTWLATGPGLVTRAVAAWLAHNLGTLGSDTLVLERHELRSAVVPGLPLPYKSSEDYWLHAEARR